MGKFNIRRALPASNDPRIKFYRNGNKGGYSWCINGSPTNGNCNVTANCVGWACSRFNEINDILTGAGFKFKTLCCNAENFIERAISAGLSVYPYPVLGGIMVWQKGATLSGSDGAGHVAIVEDITEWNSNGLPKRIYTSESGYGGSYFWNQYRNDTGNWNMSSGYKFRGCIAQPKLGKCIESNSGAKPAEPSQPSAPSGKIKIGDKVIISGSLYRSSNADAPSGSIKDKKTTITRYVANAKHPYNTTGDLGWMNESDIQLIESYSKGNYKTTCNMNVRTGAGTNNPIKKVSQLTADGKKNATSTNPNANAVYKTGTIFTALEIINSNGVWAKTPSGYVCIKGASGTVYCTKA